jgi:hypothetical protein
MNGIGKVIFDDSGALEKSRLKDLASRLAATSDAGTRPVRKSSLKRE